MKKNKPLPNPTQPRAQEVTPSTYVTQPLGSLAQIAHFLIHKDYEYRPQSPKEPKRGWGPSIMQD